MILTLSLFCMASIIVSVCRYERRRSKSDNNQELDSEKIGVNDSVEVAPSISRDDKAEEDKYHATKVIAVQVFAYLLSILFVCLNAYISLISTAHGRSDFAAYYHLLSRPPHGVVSCVIFVGHKAYEKIRADNSITIRSAIWKVVTTRNEPVYVFDNLNQVVLETSAESDLRADEGHLSFSKSLDPTRRPGPETIPQIETSDDTTPFSPPNHEQNESLDESNLHSKNDGSSSGAFFFFREKNEFRSNPSLGGFSEFVVSTGEISTIGDHGVTKSSS